MDGGWDDRGHRKLIEDLETDQMKVGEGLFACRDLFIWLDQLRRQGLSSDMHKRLTGLVQQAVAGLTVSKKWLSWIRWGRHLRNYRDER